jgi:hypothetical protein
MRSGGGRSRRAAIAAVAIATLVGLAGPAHAWTLAYEAPAGCEEGEAFRARAEAQRARPDAPSEASVRVQASEAGGRWHVRLEIGLGTDAAPGARELEGTTCREVTDAAALIVAFSLDGAPVAAVPAAVPAPPTPRPVMPPAADPQPSELVDAAPSPPVWMALAVAGGLDHGMLPAVAPGLRGGLTIGWRRASLALGLATWAHVEDLDARGAGMAATAWQAQVAARVRLWRGLEAGAGLEIGQLDAVAVGVDSLIPRTVGWQGAGGSLAWRQPLWGDLDFTLETEGLWPFVRPSFQVDGETRFVPGLCVRVWTGLAWRFL